jgi:cytochrome c oxidase subunit 3
LAHPAVPPSSHAHGAHEEHHGSFWPIILAFGATLFLLGSMYHLLLVPGFIILVASVFGWVREDVHELRGKPFQEGHSDYWLGVIVLILSEIIIFGVLFAFYFWSRAHTADFVPEPMHAMSDNKLGTTMIPIYLNTAFLLSSGVTAEVAMHHLKADRLGRFKLWLGITVLLGLAFVLGQAREYVEFSGEGVTPIVSVYGTAFYSLTGVHGLHVIAGVVALSTILVLSFTGFIRKERASGVHGAFLYWHFVDAIWLLVLSVIYLRLI